MVAYYIPRLISFLYNENSFPKYTKYQLERVYILHAYIIQSSSFDRINYPLKSEFPSPLLGFDTNFRIASVLALILIWGTKVNHYALGVQLSSVTIPFFSQRWVGNFKTTCHGEPFHTKTQLHLSVNAIHIISRTTYQEIIHIATPNTIRQNSDQALSQCKSM